MKHLAPILTALALTACPKAPGVPSVPTEQAVPQTMEIAPAESLPASLRVRFSAKLRVPGRAIPSLPGMLLVDSPRFRMVLNGPIGEPSLPPLPMRRRWSFSTTVKDEHSPWKTGKKRGSAALGCRTSLR